MEAEWLGHRFLLVDTGGWLPAGSELDEKVSRQVESAVEPGAPLSEHLLRGQHATTVNDLQREGDRTLGSYRTGPVRIAQAEPLPPDRQAQVDAEVGQAIAQAVLAAPLLRG